VFSFDFYNKGSKVRVTVDDSLPVKQWGRSAFLPMNLRKSPNGAWWGPILEKGAAKFYGRYENMNGGLPAESLYALTGMPTVSFRNIRTSESDIWGYLSDAD
jgi:hypothetical protein